MEKPLIVFDVNETLLDLDSMHGFFERIFHDRNMLRLWFTNLILYSEALSLAESYERFGDIAAATLHMLADAQGIRLSNSDAAELKSLISKLPAYPEIPDSLTRLKTAGFRLFTLTNNPAPVQKSQLETAGILDQFEQRFSVDDVKRHKPAREVYERVQQILNVAPSSLLMVACHTWDTLGAVAAGWQAALIRRPGNALLPLGPQPTLVADSLSELVEQLIDRFGSK